MDEAQCRRILEVPADASMEDIARAYHLMKRLYENERAVFSAPSMDEFSPEARSEVLAELEAAFRELCRIHAQSEPPARVRPVSLADLDRPIDGRALRAFREGAGVTLEYVSSRTHVRLEHLAALEEDRYWDLPPAAVNVRGFLSAYAAEIGLPVDEVVPAYMDRFQKWRDRKVR